MRNQNKYMKMCFKLAQKGEGKTSPNPIVGAVLVDNDGNVKAKGFHRGYGLDHAEVDCIKNYEKIFGKDADYSDMTLFVNLEPCNHFGETPPCTDLILKKNIKNVVIALKDPNPKHSGGIEKLKKSGVKVVSGVLENEAKQLNEIFFKNVNLKKTFTALKIASTLDGKIAAKNGSSKWITSDKSRNYVQKLRNKYDAILTSSNTVISDNPSLTARGKRYKNPIRIILDSKLKTDPNSKVYNNDGIKVFVFYTKADKYINSPKSYPSNVNLIRVKSTVEGRIDLNAVEEEIFKAGIRSILVEAGGILCGEFLKQKLVDKIYLFTAPKIAGDKNAKSFIEGFDINNINECRNFEITTLKKLTPDILFELYPKQL